MEHTARRPVHLILAGAGAVGLFFAAPGPAAATAPVDRGHFTDSGSFDSEICGLDVHIEGTIKDTYVLRVAKDSDGQAFPVHDSLHITERITLADDDETTNAFVTTKFHDSFTEQRATHVEGNVYEFEGVSAGSYTLYASDGRALVRDRGSVHFSFLFDTLGDGQPGGVYGPETAVVRGPHLSDEEFCGILVAELT